MFLVTDTSQLFFSGAFNLFDIWPIFQFLRKFPFLTNIFHFLTKFKFLTKLQFLTKILILGKLSVSDKKLKYLSNILIFESKFRYFGKNYILFLPISTLDQNFDLWQKNSIFDQTFEILAEIVEILRPHKCHTKKFRTFLDLKSDRKKSLNFWVFHLRGWRYSDKNLRRPEKPLQKFMKRYNLIIFLIIFGEKVIKWWSPR